MVRLLSSRWETFPGWGRDQSHIWPNGFPPWGTQYITASVKIEDDHISTHHSEKWAKQMQEDLQEQMWDAGIYATWQTKRDLIVSSCPAIAQYALHVEKPVHQKSQQLTLLHPISSSRTGRFLHALQTACYELDMNGKPESHVCSVLGSAKWFCHPAGLIAGVEQSCTACVRGRLCRQAVAGRKLSFGFSTELIPYYLAWGIQSVIDPDINYKKHHSWFLSLSQIDSVNHPLSQSKQVLTTSSWDSLLGIVM